MPGLVFIDRDGTINVEKHYLDHPDKIELLPGAAEGIRLLHETGYTSIVVSNQSGIGRGYFTMETLDAIHARLAFLLREQGAFWDGIYVCPHLPEDRCSCRKPSPGLAIKAAEERGRSISGSFVIGDKKADIDLGKNIQAKTILVLTGYGRKTQEKGDAQPDFVAENLFSAASWILQISS